MDRNVQNPHKYLDRQRNRDRDREKTELIFPKNQYFCFGSY